MSCQTNTTTNNIQKVWLYIWNRFTLSIGGFRTKNREKEREILPKKEKYDITFQSGSSNVPDIILLFTVF